VFYLGKPAVGAVVFFHPILQGEPGEELLVKRPMGRVEEDGSFEVSTFAVKDGAPPGQYRVSVVWQKNMNRGDDSESILPAEYMDPTTSRLPIITVAAEANVLPPFQLGKE
jgi:hypothetical protein